MSDVNVGTIIPKMFFVLTIQAGPAGTVPYSCVWELPKTIEVANGEGLGKPGGSFTIPKVKYIKTFSPQNPALAEVAVGDLSFRGDDNGTVNVSIGTANDVHDGLMYTVSGNFVTFLPGYFRSTSAPEAAQLSILADIDI
jgi:hypothetical protein